MLAPDTFVDPMRWPADTFEPVPIPDMAAVWANPNLASLDCRIMVSPPVLCLKTLEILPLDGA